MKYDYATIYNKNAAFFEKRPLAKRLLILFNQYAPYFFVLAYPLLWLYGATDGAFEAKEFLKIFCAPALAFIIVSALRLMLDRPRPFAEHGAGITPLKAKKNSGSSFPSRHVACAAVIAMSYLPFLPAVSALLFILTFAIGYARFAIGWHYPSDLFVGLGLGVLVGLGMYLPL